MSGAWLSANPANMPACPEAGCGLPARMLTGRKGGRGDGRRRWRNKAAGGIKHALLGRAEFSGELPPGFNPSLEETRRALLK